MFQAFVCLVRDLAPVRVVDNHHHHVQLRGHVDGQQNCQQRQDYPLTPAGGAGTSLHGISTLNLPMHLDCNALGNLHCRDVHQDSGDGIHSPRELLPEEHVEHHGFCCCGIGVRIFIL